MNFNELAENMTPELYEQIKRAVELGKWADGRIVEPEQRELCMEAMILFEARNLPEHLRTGYMPKDDNACEDKDIFGGFDAAEPKPIKWLN